MVKLFYGWWVAFGSFVTLFTIVGLLYYGFPVFYPYLIESFGWSRADTMAGYAISTFVIGPIFGVSAGILIDRYGSKKIMLAGIVMAGTALLSFSLMQSLMHFYIFYFMHTIGYACAGPVPNQVLIAQWFKRYRGRVMGMAYLGLGLGGTAAPLVFHYLISSYGWRGALRILGGIILLVLLPLIIWIVRARPSEMGLLPDGEVQPAAATAASASNADFTLSEAVRTRAFWVICVGSVLSIASIGAVIQHLVLYLGGTGNDPGMGFTKADAAWILSLLVISSIPGRIIMGFLADVFPKKYVMLAAYVLVGGSVPLLFFADVYPMAYIFAVIFGFGMGADYMMIPLVTAEAFGVSSMGKIMGAIFVSDTLGQALFPYIVGFIYDRTGDYQLAFWLVTAAALAGAFAILFLPRRVPKAVSQAPEVAVGTN